MEKWKKRPFSSKKTVHFDQKICKNGEKLSRDAYYEFYSMCSRYSNARVYYFFMVLVFCFSKMNPDIVLRQAGQSNFVTSKITTPRLKKIKTAEFGNQNEAVLKGNPQENPCRAAAKPLLNACSYYLSNARDS